MCAAAAHAEPASQLRASTATLLDPWDERPGEDHVEQWTRAALGLRAPFGEGEAFSELQALHLVLSGATGTESAAALRLGEAGWRGPVGRAWLSAGNLMTPAGQLAVLSPLDVLSPRDLRAGLAAAPADLRLPAPAVSLEMGTQTVVQLLWMPLGARDLVPLIGTDASLVRQGMLQDAVHGLQAQAADQPALIAPTATALADALGAQVARANPQTRRALEQAVLDTQRPAPVTEASDLAVRLRGSAGPVQLEALAAWMRSRRPALRVAPELGALVTGAARIDALGWLAAPPELDDAVSVSWPRTAVVGGGLSVPVGPLLCTAEGAWTSSRVVQRQGLGAVTRAVSSAAAGAEWTPAGQPALIGGELRVEKLHDIVDPDGLLLAVPLNAEAAAYVEWRLWRERLALQGGALGSFAFRELALRPGARVDLHDGLWLELGGLWIPSAAPAPRSLAAVAGFEGGPIGALSDTEHLRVGLSWAR